MTQHKTTLDSDAYPKGPNGLAAFCEDRIAELEQAKAECRTRAERKPINQQLHSARLMLRWLRTRAGYTRPIRPGEASND